jgi:hypothetical protein
MSRPSKHPSHRAIVLLLAAPLWFTAAACEREDTSGDAPIVFDDPHREGARLTIVEFGDGLGISVTAPIGRPVPTGRGLSLVELYRLLHPEDVDVPPELVALSARAEALARTRAPQADAPQPELPPAAIEKSSADFYGRACVTFEEWDNRYTPQACIYRTSQVSVTVPLSGCNSSPSGCYPITFDDRTFAWNENPFTTRLLWYNPASDNHRWDVQPYAWGWYNVSSPGVQTWSANLSTYPHNVNGTIGLTWHNHTIIPPR